MANVIPDTKNEAPPPNVPNFREDERILARYASMLERRIKTFYVEHESSIRRNASTKRSELRDQASEAQEEWETRKEAAELARAAYQKAYPQHVKKTRFEEPSMLENMRSLGAAAKLHAAAKDAWLAEQTALSNIRRIEHNEAQLEVELERAIERAPIVSKEVTESAKWLAEIHAEEELANVKANVDEIKAERAAYAARLAAGNVPLEEIRLRAFGEADIKHVQMPLSGFIFYRVDVFGPKAYFVLRDLRKQLYALPYDQRLEPILGGVYDIVKAGQSSFEIRPCMKDPRTPFSLLDHFAKCSEDLPEEGRDEAIQEASRQHAAFVKQRRMLATLSEVDETEANVIALFADLAEKKQ
jgi:hypothetical protein